MVWGLIGAAVATAVGAGINAAARGRARKMARKQQYENAKRYSKERKVAVDEATSSAEEAGMHQAIGLARSGGGTMGGQSAGTQAAMHQAPANTAAAQLTGARIGDQYMAGLTQSQGQSANTAMMQEQNRQIQNSNLVTGVAKGASLAGQGIDEYAESKGMGTGSSIGVTEGEAPQTIKQGTDGGSFEVENSGYADDVANAWTDSDIRAKENIQGSDAVDVFRNTPGYEYDYRKNFRDRPGAERGPQAGIMAQDLEKTPAGKTVVNTGKDGVKQIDTQRLSLLQAGAMEGMIKQQDEMQAKLQALESGTTGASIGGAVGSAALPPQAQMGQAQLESMTYPATARGPEITMGMAQEEPQYEIEMGQAVLEPQYEEMGPPQAPLMQGLTTLLDDESITSDKRTKNVYSDERTKQNIQPMDGQMRTTHTMPDGSQMANSQMPPQPDTTRLSGAVLTGDQGTEYETNTDLVTRLEQQQRTHVPVGAAQDISIQQGGTPQAQGAPGQSGPTLRHRQNAGGQGMNPAQLDAWRRANPEMVQQPDGTWIRNTGPNYGVGDQPNNRGVGQAWTGQQMSTEEEARLNVNRGTPRMNPAIHRTPSWSDRQRFQGRAEGGGYAEKFTAPTDDRGYPMPVVDMRKRALATSEKDRREKSLSNARADEVGEDNAITAQRVRDDFDAETARHVKEGTRRQAPGMDTVAANTADTVSSTEEAESLMGMLGKKPSKRRKVKPKGPAKPAKVEPKGDMKYFEMAMREMDPSGVALSGDMVAKNWAKLDARAKELKAKSGVK